MFEWKQAFENTENGCFELSFLFFNYECSIIVVSIIELTVYTLDGLILNCVFPNMDLYVCDFPICDTGMKVEEMEKEKMSALVFLFFFNMYMQNFLYP